MADFFLKNAQSPSLASFFNFFTSPFIVMNYICTLLVNGSELQQTLPWCTMSRLCRQRRSCWWRWRSSRGTTAAETWKTLSQPSYDNIDVQCACPWKGGIQMGMGNGGRVHQAHYVGWIMHSRSAGTQRRCHLAGFICIVNYVNWFSSSWNSNISSFFN
jgi:hypothetical protein